MNQLDRPNFTHLLHERLQKVGISSFKALAETAQVSKWQVTQLRQGRASQMRLEPLLKLSQTLQIPLTELLSIFAEVNPGEPGRGAESEPTIAELKQEYQRLESQLVQQRESLQQEFEQSSLQILESWLRQWPSAAHAAQQKPDAPAVKLLPLLRPIEQLLQQWGVEAIAPVGTEVAYDARSHQLTSGTVQPGDPVMIKKAGYWHRGKLLFRAQVEPLSSHAASQ